MNPDSIQLQIIKTYNIDIFKFNVMQSIVSLPSVLCCVLAGFLMDAIGLARSALIFAGLTILGSTLFAISAHSGDFNLALIGRGIYGVGSECQLIWFNCLCTIWFFYNEGSFASGVGQSFGRLGGFLAGLTTPLIYQRTQEIADTFWVCALLNLLAVPFLLLINHYDRENMKRRRHFRLARQESLHHSFHQSQNRSTSGAKRAATKSEAASEMAASRADSEMRRFREAVLTQRRVSLASIRKFRGEFWFILVITFLDKLTIQPLL